MSSPGERMDTTHISVPPPPRPDDNPRAGYPARPFATPYGPAPGEAPPLSSGRTVAGLRIPGASTSYIILGLLLLAAGIVCLIMPYRLSLWFFRHKFAHGDVLFEELWRILAACLLTAATTTFGLKVASDRGQLDDFAVQRLQHGFFWFALITILLHLVHLLFVKALTFWGLVIGGVVMGVTLLVPAVHLGMSGGFSLQPMWEGTVVCFGNLFAPRRFSTPVFLYSLLTLLFTVAGLLYIIIPTWTLRWTFGYDKGRRSTFLWQVIGAAMVTLFPGITYTLEERAIEGRLFTTLAKVLNVGLLISALFHILEFGSLLVDGGIDGRILLVVLFAHWVLVLLASILGLSATEPQAAPAYEYEPLAADTMATA